ncbi:tripartite tricarboxylate transporter substrate binding protein BugD [Roseococcus sp. SDR]|uniref:Bug family tripartite tricarboxylate transporter substrate binding protein n=1 Tax=Roseococcus sp. SDR TaxID=2835532 RepID=UPI001BCDC74F|nr:tripartite tricarboxylate transporter substrate-binding protein [Roseococcus sp. SDR]MBS7789670.1 tripartite tricarboxylate transporter substrate binding protein BugD [Roseococcus sp. SDR]MBV1844984.1 tripartite tricarboxylate transporter substrate binding protein BugD [Roseococcus sp. SDR]
MLRRAFATGLMAASLLAPPAFAQTYPSRTITLVAAGAAGGPTDTITRITADALSRTIGQNVVVEAIGGSVVGPQRVAQARPDGYTLLLNNIGMAASATLFRRLPYDVPGSFAPLGLVSDAAMTVVARPGFPASDMAGLMAVLRREGEGLNLATSGLGGASNLCGLLLQRDAQARATVVVFRGTGPAIAELLAGRIDLMCDQATNTVPYLRDGRIRAFAVSSPTRLAGLPEVPTTAEAGFPGISMSTWHGLYAPAGTPEAVQEHISAALRQALRDDRLRQRFAELLTDPATEERASIAFHRRFVVEEVQRWRPVIQAAGAYAD